MRLPLVGALFRSELETSERSELIILITPTAVKDPGEARAISEELMRRMKEAPAPAWMRPVGNEPQNDSPPKESPPKESQPKESPSARQPSPSMPDSPLSVGATTATVATQVNATSAPKDTTSQPTTGAEEVEKAPSPAARVGAKRRTELEPVPANRPLDDPAPVSRPAAMPQSAGAARACGLQR